MGQPNFRLVLLDSIEVDIEAPALLGFVDGFGRGGAFDFVLEADAVFVNEVSAEVGPPTWAVAGLDAAGTQRRWPGEASNGTLWNGERRDLNRIRRLSM